MAGPTNVALGEAELSSEQERKSVRKLYGSGSLTSPSKTFQSRWRPTETMQAVDCTGLWE